MSTGHLYDAFFYEAFSEEAETIEKLRPPRLRFGYFPHTIQEAGHAEPPAPLLSIRTQSQIPPEWSALLSGILTRSTGYDHILAWLGYTRAAIPCGYLPLYCARAVAEQAAMLWLALLRRLPEQMTHFSAFDRDGLTGREAAGRCLLVVGVGHIGHEIVRIGRGMDMRVLGVDIVKKHNDVNYVTIEQGLPHADVIVCAMSLNESNYRYFNYARLRQAPSGVIFVNIARGEMSPASDLLQLLGEGHLGGVGLDVFGEEAELAVSLRRQRETSSAEVRALLAMRSHPRVIFTPHNAFNTEEAVRRKAEQSIKQIVHVMNHGAFRWPVPAAGSPGNSGGGD